MIRTALRVLVVSALAVALPAVGPVNADAAESELTAFATAWFWAHQTEPVPVAGVAPPRASDPTVPEGDVAVAGPSVDGGAEKLAYVAFPLDTVPAAATLQRFSVTLPIDPDATQAYDTAAPPPLVACAVRGTWTEANGPQSWSTRPDEDCSVQATGSYADEAWTFDVTAIAERWRREDLNTGFVVMPQVESPNAPVQVVFGAKNTLRAKVSWVAALPSGVPVPVDTEPAPLEPTPAWGSGVVSGPPAGPVGATVAPSPVPTTVQPPQAAAPQQQRIVRAAVQERSALPVLLGGGSALAVAILLCGLVLGAPRTRSESMRG